MTFTLTKIAILASGPGLSAIKQSYAIRASRLFSDNYELRICDMQAISYCKSVLDECEAIIIYVRAATVAEEMERVHDLVLTSLRLARPVTVVSDIERTDPVMDELNQWLKNLGIDIFDPRVSLMISQEAQKDVATWDAAMCGVFSLLLRSQLNLIIPTIEGIVPKAYIWDDYNEYCKQQHYCCDVTNWVWHFLVEGESRSALIECDIVAAYLDQMTSEPFRLIH